MEKKQAAFDEIMDAPLEKVSAADLLAVMAERPEVAQAVSILPEKKKVELEVEPVIPRLRLRDLVEKLRLRGEKKKVEVELGPLKAKYEGPIFEGIDQIINPVVFDSLLNRLEERLRDRLNPTGTGGG